MCVFQVVEAVATEAADTEAATAVRTAGAEEAAVGAVAAPIGGATTAAKCVGRLPPPNLFQLFLSLLFFLEHLAFFAEICNDRREVGLPVSVGPPTTIQIHTCCCLLWQLSRRQPLILLRTSF